MYTFRLSTRPEPDRWFGKLREKIIRIGAVPSEETEARGAPIIVADD